MFERCAHPNILSLLDAYQITGEPTTIYLVTEPWAPYTLESFLCESNYQREVSNSWFARNDESTEEQMIRIFKGIADGLSYLHKNLIKHKDIKPENIPLCDDDPKGIRPIIADFGVSKIFHQGGPTHLDGSTYRYLAPEQMGHIESTLKSDVWQMGCCFSMILVVFHKGSGGYDHLLRIFEDSGTPCNIALEASSFLKALDQLCGLETVSQLHMLRIVRGMLEVVPASRSNITAVREELLQLA